MFDVAEDGMSQYLDDDRGPGFAWLEEAIVLLFAILGTILSNFMEDIKRARRPRRRV